VHDTWREKAEFTKMTIFIPVFFIDDYTKTKMAFDENELIFVTDV